MERGHPCLLAHRKGHVTINLIALYLTSPLNFHKKQYFESHPVRHDNIIYAETVMTINNGSKTRNIHPI